MGQLSGKVAIVTAGRLNLAGLNALARAGDPQADIAPIAVFLASDASQFITGATLFADGGRSIDTAR